MIAVVMRLRSCGDLLSMTWRYVGDALVRVLRCLGYALAMYLVVLVTSWQCLGDVLVRS